MGEIFIGRGPIFSPLQWLVFVCDFQISAGLKLIVSKKNENDENAGTKANKQHRQES